MKTSYIGLDGKFLITFLMIALLLVGFGQAQTTAYPRMAPIEQYQMSRAAEIAMARTAAAESISRDAEILVLGRTDFEVAAKGKNGFVCMVQRSWAAGVEDAEFWNPKLRAPICFNAEAARSFLPHVMKKTEWALAGLSKEQIAERLKAALSNKEFPEFGPGAMCYMMSKDGYLSDHDGHWHPHLMFFTSAVAPSTWGAQMPGSPLLAFTDKTEDFTVFLLPVSKWSDGTAAPPME